jgi:hypothetical protein
MRVELLGLQFAQGQHPIKHHRHGDAAYKTIPCCIGITNIKSVRSVSCERPTTICCCRIRSFSQSGGQRTSVHIDNLASRGVQVKS